MAKRKPKPEPPAEPAGMPSLPGLPETPVGAVLQWPEPSEPPAPVEPADIDGEIVVSGEHKGRMEPIETAAIGYLNTAGYTVAQIAEIVGRNPETVRRNLPHAKNLLKAFVPEMLGLWVDAARTAALKGNHHPMRDFVYAAGAATHAAGGPGGPVMQVAIGIQLPGLPQPKNDNGPEE